MKDLIVALAPIVVKVLEFLRLRKRPDPIKKEIERCDLVTSRLTDLRVVHVKCDRVYVLQFHNGGRFYTGASMQKFTCTYEDISSDIFPVQQLFQATHVNLLRTIVKEILRNGYCYCSKVDNFADPGVRHSMLQRGVQSFAIVPIYDIKGFFIGLTVMEWVNGPAFITKEHIAQAQSTSGIISAYLKKNFDTNE